MLGRKDSEETCAKVSASLMGNYRYLGYKHSSEARAAMSLSKSNSVPIEVTDLELETNKLFIIIWFTQLKP
jgi:hypothetical protein